MDNLLFATVGPSRKSWKGPTVGGLSRVATLRGSDPLHHSGAYPKVIGFPPESLIRIAPEWVIDLLRITHSEVPFSKNMCLNG